jgi:cystinosin
MNYERQSTEGWNITQILLDLIGGLFSALQLVLDAADLNEWGSVTGNIQKLLLGGLTVVFDSIFIFQHYVMYYDHQPTTRTAENIARIKQPYQPLIHENDSDDEERIQ